MRKINVIDYTDGQIKLKTNLHLAFDGSCEPKNPGGVACIGWLITDEDDPQKEILVKGYEVVADGGKLATNNFAEYCALGYPLKWLKDNGWRGSLSVKGDSKLVVSQVNREWKCNAEHLIKLRQRVWDLLEELELDDSNFSIEWVPRDFNEEADELGRVAYKEYCQANNKPVKYMYRKKKK